jgi:hypothetical protein
MGRSASESPESVTGAERQMATKGAKEHKNSKTQNRNTTHQNTKVKRYYGAEGRPVEFLTMGLRELSDSRKSSGTSAGPSP